MSGLVTVADVRGPEDAPVLVLGPSLGTTSRLWQAQLGVLARTHRVVRYELPGHTGAPAPPGPYSIDRLGRSVLASVDELGVVRFAYAGVSVGGLVGVWLASEVPERVDRLALLNTAARVGTAEGWRERAAAVRTRGLPPLAEGIVARWFAAGTVAAEPRLVAEHRDALAAVDAEGYAGCCEALAAADLHTRLAAVTAPTLVVTGDEDPVVSVADAAALADGIAGARLETVPRTAHLSCVERPDAVRGLLAGHFRGAADPAAYARGTGVRRRVLGDAHVDRAVARTDAFTADFQDLVTRYAWGELWAGDGLDRVTRRHVTTAILAALGREGELAMHVGAAVRDGVPLEQIREVLLHVAVYAGVPAANAAFAVAREVLRENGPPAGSEGDDDGS
ncbi:MAG TPA: 3-oxoadipate enol-lactonase [Streptosporangiales bacterium]